LRREAPQLYLLIMKICDFITNSWRIHRFW
jgi:hypothetical protein